MISKYLDLLQGKISRDTIKKVVEMAVQDAQTDVVSRLRDVLETYPEARNFKLDLQQPFMETAPTGLSGVIDTIEDQETLPGLYKKTATVSDLYERVNKLVLDEIKKGTTPWTRPWNNTNYRLGCSYATNKPYSYANQLLIKEQFFKLDNPYFMTVDKVKKEGGKLIKKHRLTDIFVIAHLWSFVKNHKREVFYSLSQASQFVNSNYKGDKKELKAIVDAGYRQFLSIQTVVNGKYITGIDFKLKEKQYIAGATDNVNEPIAVADAIINNYPDPNVPIKHKSQGRAFYSLGSDSVTMPLKADFVNSEKYYATLFHELVHSTGHHSRLDRLKFSFFGVEKEDRAAEELVAEIGASYLSAEAGILHHHIKNTADYVKGWHSALSSKIDEDSTFLLTAMKHAERAAEFMLQRNSNGTPLYMTQLLEQQEKEQQEKDQKATEEKAKKEAAKFTREDYLEKLAHHIEYNYKGQYLYDPSTFLTDFFNSYRETKWKSMLDAYKNKKTNIDLYKSFVEASEKRVFSDEIAPYLKHLKPSEPLELISLEKKSLESQKSKATKTAKTEINKQLSLFDDQIILMDAKGLNNPNALMQQMAWQINLLRIKHKRKTAQGIYMVGEPSGILKKHLGGNSIVVDKKVIAPVIKESLSRETFYQLTNLMDLLNNPYAIFHNAKDYTVIIEIEGVTGKKYMLSFDIKTGDKLTITKISKFSQQDLTAHLIMADLAYSQKGMKSAKKGLASPEVEDNAFAKAELKEPMQVGKPVVINKPTDDFYKTETTATTNFNPDFSKNTNKTETSLRRTGEPNPEFPVTGVAREFFGRLEVKPVGSISIALDADSGAGKTTAGWKFMNDFAAAGNRCLFLSLEEHKDSNLFQEKIDKFIDPENEKYIRAESDIDSKEHLDKLINAADYVFTDSWQKLSRKIKGLNYDDDFRNGYDGKVLLTIFQKTTDGKTKGGSDKIYDSDIVVNGVAGNVFSDNYFTFYKNRYTEVEKHKVAYNVANHKVFDPTLNDSNSPISESKQNNHVVAWSGEDLQL